MLTSAKTENRFISAAKNDMKTMNVSMKRLHFRTVGWSLKIEQLVS